ncbi:MAG: carboxypeptidase-like regulatory domain-containing protein [Bacteroidetes bacterium]|jgi:hypothetical protein|nr:carboxypeptidase-like regulatory domain-containing protein [Bacteroidota bacterium]
MRTTIIMAMLTLWLGGVATPSVAQTSLEGIVLDAETGESLPAANIRIADTYRGTISNNEGVFTLEPPAYPVTLIVRYIGYETLQRTIEAPPDEPITLALTPRTLDMEELVVTAPNATEIMAQVIANKQTWWDDLESFEADAYTRFTVRNDTGIVSMTETQTRAFWRSREGFREVVLYEERTANLEGPAGGPSDALPAALFVTNLYDDDVEVAGHRLRGVTHPKALDHYTFTLDSVRVRGDQRVYDLSVEPKSRLASAFQGRIAVLDEEFAMIEAALEPGPAFRFPAPVEDASVRMTQQFSSEGGPFWVPVDFRAAYSIDVGLGALLRIPTIQVTQTSRLSDYAVNRALPDSLFADAQRTRSDSASVAWAEARRSEALRSEARPSETQRLQADRPEAHRPEAAPLSRRAVPLTAEETTALATIDSTQTLARAFEPTGLLRRLTDFGVDTGNGDTGSGDAGRGEASRRLSSLQVGGRPLLRYNRVEGGLAGVQVAARKSRARAHLRGGYRTQSTGASHWMYGGGLTLTPTADTRLETSYRYTVDRAYTTPRYGRILNTLWAVNGLADYFDYLGAERVRVTLHHRLRSINSRVQVSYRGERQFSVAKGTDFDVWGQRMSFRDNPSIDDGTLHALTARWTWGTVEVPVAVGAQQGAALEVTHAAPDLGSDFSYTRLAGEAVFRVPTFYQRRLVPNTLDIRVEGSATVGGRTPVQALTHLEVAMLPYTPFGGLRTTHGTPYRGEHHAGVFWEHNFRSVPFEAIGLERGRDVALIIHGGHGRTWTGSDRQAQLAASAPGLRTMTQWHHEVGLSLSGGASQVLRLDLSARLDRPGWSLGVSAARLF